MSCQNESFVHVRVQCGNDVCKLFLTKRVRSSVSKCVQSDFPSTALELIEPSNDVLKGGKGEKRKGGDG